MAQHNCSVFCYGPNRERLRFLHGSTNALLVCFKGLVGGAEAWDGSTSPLTPLVCTWRPNLGLLSGY
jgi:hypothetical protein